MALKKILISLFLLGCGPVKDIELPPLYTLIIGSGQSQRVGVVSSDLGPAGRFSTITEDGLPIPGAYVNIHSDAEAFYYQNKIYILNKLNRDNLQIINPGIANLTEAEFSLGNKSNPQQIAFVNNERAFISLYSRSEILIVNPKIGQITGSIPLGQYADADGVVEVNGLYYYKGKLYVFLQRLDRNSSAAIWPPTDYSLILEIESDSGTVLAEYKTLATNPIGNPIFTNLFGEPHLVYACPGFQGYNFQLDGGVEAFNLNTKQIRNPFLIAETTVKGDILDVAIKNDTTGYINVQYQDFSSAIIKFNPSNGQIIQQLAFYPASGGYVSGMMLSPNGYLYIGDASFSAPGVMIYNTNQDDRKLFPTPVNIGLRPTGFVWIP